MAIAEGIGRLADIQKFALDVLIRQNTATADLMKQALRAAGSEPAAALAGRVEEAFGEYLGAQKLLVDACAEIQQRCLDLLEQQSATAFVNAAKFMKGSAA